MRPWSRPHSHRHDQFHIVATGPGQAWQRPEPGLVCQSLNPAADRDWLKLERGPAGDPRRVRPWPWAPASVGPGGSHSVGWDNVVVILEIVPGSWVILGA